LILQAPVLPLLFPEKRLTTGTMNSSAKKQ